MSIFLTKKDLWEGASEEEARDVVRELRRRGFNVLMGDTFKRGQMTVREALALATAVAEISAGITLAEGADRLGDDTKIMVAAVPGHEPLWRYAAVWGRMTLEERTAVIANYHSECQGKDWEAKAEPTGLSPRIAAAVTAVVSHLPHVDRLVWQVLDVEFVEEDLENYRGQARAFVNKDKGASGHQIVLRNGLSDAELVYTICHEILHTTRQHHDLSSYTHDTEERSLLLDVFERQANCLTPQWAYAIVATDFKL